MQMKKHFLAAALALGVGVGAASLPAADVQPPTAQLGYVTVGSLVQSALAWWWRDSAGCGPYDLNVHCTGTPAFPGSLNGLFGF